MRAAVLVVLAACSVSDREAAASSVEGLFVAHNDMPAFLPGYCDGPADLGEPGPDARPSPWHTFSKTVAAGARTYQGVECPPGWTAEGACEYDDGLTPLEGPSCHPGRELGCWADGGERPATMSATARCVP